MLKANFKKYISLLLVVVLLATQVCSTFASEANEDHSESSESVEIHVDDTEIENEAFESIEDYEDELETENETESENETAIDDETETETETETEATDEETETEERNEELENEETIEENKDEETEEAETEAEVETEIEVEDEESEAETETETEEETTEETTEEIAETDEIEVEIIDGEIFESNKKAEKGKGTETETQTQEETETEPEPAPEEIAETVEAKKAGLPVVAWSGHPDMDPPCSEQLEVSFTPGTNPIDEIIIMVSGQEVYHYNGSPITTTHKVMVDTYTNKSAYITIRAGAIQTGLSTPQRIDHTISYNKYSHIGSKDIVAECAVCGKNCGSATLTLPTGAVVANLDPTGTRPFADPVYTSWTLSPLTIEYSNNTAVGDANDPDITKRPTYIVKDPSGGMIEKIFFTIVNPPPAPVPSGGGNSGGSSGGGGGGGTTFDPFMVKPNVTYSSQNKVILYIANGNISHWHTNPLIGKKSLTIVNEQGLTAPAINGFYQVDTTMHMIINNIESPATFSDIYYFDEYGNVVTGWVYTPDGNAYFFNNEKNNNEGKMITGWRTIEGKPHYFNPDGTLLRNGIAPDGRAVDAEGKIISNKYLIN